ncbi:hypothetical protein SODALDRAFT_330759 [Sodiomyces alkalinus F11]|uniref:Uncharacterized protein n=1 Tax=Sodiomyces alkalinus (strain CBS 110278 / VKM F-3762 / F11) TaxID=1314773 RepID=A0A3N2Q2R1_SODAK|nr:hypothetical protein SODALDRAFT_330759 [Sodiomyces alkalinus F11]ROT41040.1 hypothetical protein SODALDRAFT_330759 [Sodiomyces alkalinus F11]
MFSEYRSSVPPYLILRVDSTLFGLDDPLHLHHPKLSGFRRYLDIRGTKPPPPPPPPPPPLGTKLVSRFCRAPIRLASRLLKHAYQGK